MLVSRKIWWGVMVDAEEEGCGVEDDDVVDDDDDEDSERKSAFGIAAGGSMVARE